MVSLGLASSLPAYLVLILAIVVVWELIWKGIALWKSARHEQLAWFVCLLILNTAGILPILYIAFFQKKSKKRK